MRIQDGKKQLYGSQFNTRKSVGLDPLSDYTKELCKTYQHPPSS